MGRRATKRVTVNGSVTLHQRFLYRGYLRIACCDLTRGNHPCLWLITWDPSQPVATRPLAIQKDGTWYTYGWDLTKNICEVYGQHGYIRTNYSYSPYGKVSDFGDVTQFLQYSSEFYDSELGLVYYNYRYYNALIGAWISPDAVKYEDFFVYCKNAPIHLTDFLGNESFTFNKQGCSLKMNVKIKLTFVDEDAIVWTDESKETYKANLKNAIEGVYNNNMYTLRTSNACCPCASGITMSLNIDYVESLWDFPDWRVKVYAGEAGKRRASSSVGFRTFGAGGKLYADSYKNGITKYQYPDGSIVEIRDAQIAAAHEFGHASGQHHPGRGVNDENEKPYKSNEGPEYRHKGRDNQGREVNGEIDLMGVGNGLRPFYFDLWAEHVNSENKCCNYNVE